MNGAALLATSIGVVVFAGTIGPTSVPLHATGGAAVRLVADVNRQAPPPPKLSEVAAFAGAVLYAGEEGAHGRELWKVDAASGETQLVRDISAGPASSSPTVSRIGK